MSRADFIVNTIIPNMLESKALGDREYISYQFDPTKKIEDLVMSDIIFLILNLKIDGKLADKKVIVKFQPQNTAIRIMMNADLQYYNEIYFYKVIYPMLNRTGKCNMCPIYCSASYDDEAEKYLMIEDVGDSGYRMADGDMFLDLQHATLAMEKLGRYHALSYEAKKEHKEEFYGVVNKIKEAYWVENTEDLFYNNAKTMLERSMAGVAEKYKPRVQKLFEKIKGKNAFFKESLKAVEPMAVICHGDFVRNNLMFRYRDGKADNVKFIDFATVRYSSPMVDVSNLLFVSVSTEVRSSHLDELLQVYHKALTSACPGVSVPSLKDIKAEFQRVCFYGALVSIFYLPLLSSRITGECPFDQVKFANAETIAARNDLIRKVGGEEATRIIADIANDCLEKHYF
uniref:CHK kinase-like domain-containing protein n=1 Tax=Clastoptera arizonana TaxID=38151 RepID=A0A1B6D255_9HEMI